MVSEEELAAAEVVATHLNRLIRVVERVQMQYRLENPDAVERATYLLLVHLVRDGPRRAGALAEAVHSDPSTISRQIGHLVKLGYVERTADPVDGRATLLAATDEGIRVFNENKRLRNTAIAGMLTNWPEADRRTFGAMLDRFATEFEQHKQMRAAATPAPDVDGTERAPS